MSVIEAVSLGDNMWDKWDDKISPNTESLLMSVAQTRQLRGSNRGVCCLLRL